MKLTLLSLLLIPVFPYTGNSQITITDADFPAAGDVITVSRTAGLTIDYSSTGPDYQWDFSNLTFADQVTRTHNPLSGVPFLINLSYGPTAVTAYRSSYYLPFTDLPLNQFGNLLPVQIEDVFQYTKKNAQKMTLVGYSASINGQDIPIKSDTIETKYIYPLEFEDEYISRGYTHLDMSVFIPAEWMQQRKRTTVVDGWGAITTPFGTFDVLRVQHKIEETDSVKYNGMAFGLNIPVTYEYEWIANGEKTPILKVVTTEVMGNETVVSAEYKDHNYLSVETIGLLLLKEAGGGLLLGVLLGWVTSRLMREVDDYIISVLVTLSVVMGGYLIAHSFHISGPLAMVAAGFYRLPHPFGVCR